MHGSFINAASPSIPPALLQDSTTRRAALAITAWLPADAKTALRILDLVGVTISEGDAGKPAAKRGRTGGDDK